MRLVSCTLAGQECFTGQDLTLDNLRPINLIVGKNNTGKSALVRMLLTSMLGHPNVVKKVASKLTGKELTALTKNRALFLEEVEVNAAARHFGEHLSFQEVTVSMSTAGNIDYHCEVYLDENKHSLRNIRENGSPLSGLILHGDADFSWLFNNLRRLIDNKSDFAYLAADRDIKPEPVQKIDSQLQLQYDGENATTALKQELEYTYGRKVLINTKLVPLLNSILMPEQELEHMHGSRKRGYPGVEDKYIIEFSTKENTLYVSLDNMGSGVKTVLLVLMHTVLAYESRSFDVPKTHTFIFEELESHLHPSVLRRLLAYLRDFALETGSTLYLTTHSSTVIDFFARDENCGVIAVSINEEGKHVVQNNVIEEDLANFMADLGNRPSELFQSNGIIWVEGPSDRVYINKLIELYSEGELIEGLHYSIAFYGGALLVHHTIGSSATASSEEDHSKQLVDLLQICRRCYLVCDSDLTTPPDPNDPEKDWWEPVKKCVGQIRSLGKMAGYWVSDGKEIENYFSGDLLVKGFARNPEKASYRSPEPYEALFTNEATYWKDVFGRAGLSDKVDFARNLCASLTKAEADALPNLKDRVAKLIQTIKLWNEMLP